MKRAIAGILMMVAAATNIAAADFPIHRRLPMAAVRRTRVTIVEPRAYLAPITFAALVVTPPENQIWERSEQLTSSEGWIDFAMPVGQLGHHLYVAINDGAAQISYAEIVFDDGETQVVDFSDQITHPGLYSLVGFVNGRVIDHIRVVAKADSPVSGISLRLAA